MVMPALVPRYTIDQLESFPDDGNRYELLDGVLLVTPAPNVSHEAIVERLYIAVRSYLGESVHIFTRGAVQVPPSNHFEPDLLVIPRMPRLPKKWSDIPDVWLAVEVSGWGSRIYDRDFKHDAYHRLGVRTTWRIDILDRTATCTNKGRGKAFPTRDEIVWQAPGSDEALRLSVPSLFEGIEDDD